MLAVLGVLPLAAGAQQALPDAPSAADAVARLMSALSSPDPRARADAASKLGHIGPRAAPAVPQLLEMLADGAEFFVTDQNGHVLVDTPASCASLALGRIGAPATAGLVEATRHLDWRVRDNAIRALGEAGVRNNPEVVDALIAAVNDRKAEVRRSAALLLPGSDPRALEPLLAAAADHDELVRRIAVGKLGAFADSRAIDVLIDVVRRDAAFEAACEASQALGRARNEHAVTALIEVLRNKRRGRYVRACAASALAAFDGPQVYDALLAGSRDSDEHVREVAGGALETVESRRQPLIR